jgi:hypothetical protein
MLWALHFSSSLLLLPSQTSILLFRLPLPFLRQLRSGTFHAQDCGAKEEVEVDPLDSLLDDVEDGDCCIRDSHKTGS